MNKKISLPKTSKAIEALFQGKKNSRIVSRLAKAAQTGKVDGVALHNHPDGNAMLNKWDKDKLEQIQQILTEEYQRNAQTI